MRRTGISRWHSWPAILLGGIFVISGAAKAPQPELTFAGIQQYQLLDANAAYFLAEWLPWLEIALGGLLWIPFTRKIGLGMAGALQLIFLAALAQAVFRGLEIVCVCFGTPLGRTGGLFLQEAVLLVLTAWAIRREWIRTRK